MDNRLPGSTPGDTWRPLFSDPLLTPLATARRAAALTTATATATAATPAGGDGRTHQCAEAMVGERPCVDGRWMPPRHVLVTIVCRSGRVVPGPEELFWLLAWRYSNHLAAAFNGDVYLVTEHGWTGCGDKRAGFTPALHPRSVHLSVLQPEGRLP